MHDFRNKVNTRKLPRYLIWRDLLGRWIFCYRSHSNWISFIWPGCLLRWPRDSLFRQGYILLFPSPLMRKKNLKYLSFFVVSLIYLTANYNGKKKHWNNVIRFYLKLNTPDFKVMRGNLNLKLKSNILVTLTVALKQFYRHRRVLNRRNLGRGIVFLVWFAQLHIDSLKGRLVTQKNLFSAYKIVSFALLINVIDWTHKTL